MNKIRLKELTRLMVGLMFFGLGITFIVQARIGVPPWDVLAQGLSKVFGLSFGTGVILVSALVLLIWIPLRIKPGFGTIANGILIGLWANLFMSFVSPAANYGWSVGMLLLGISLVATASGLYISANLGAGPRDGLMIGSAKLLQKPLWLVRTGYELSALGLGWALGGQFREGTVLFALVIGPLMHRSIDFFKKSA
ncbi:MAG: YczE/YyaS/YitT family protein [Micrococcales bacterium]